MEYEIEKHIDQLHLKVIELGMEIDRRLTALEKTQAEMLEREKGRIHHTKIADNKPPSGMDPMEVNPEHVY